VKRDFRRHLSGVKLPLGERGVSVEMKQRNHVKAMILTTESGGGVLFEGNLGQIVELSMLDDSVLEMRCINGILRVDLALEELEDMALKIRSGRASGSALGSLRSTNIEMN
jgi:hypothetical protein